MISFFLRFGMREHQEILWGCIFQQNVQIPKRAAYYSIGSHSA